LFVPVSRHRARRSAILGRLRPHAWRIGAGLGVLCSLVVALASSPFQIPAHGWLGLVLFPPILTLVSRWLAGRSARSLLRLGLAAAACPPLLIVGGSWLSVCQPALQAQAVAIKSRLLGQSDRSTKDQPGLLVTSESGELQMSILGAELLPAPPEDRGSIVITLGITNPTHHTKLDDLVVAPEHAMLVDNYGNRYNSTVTTDDPAAVHVGGIYPGETIRLKLRYEAPVEACTHLDLTVSWPAARFGPGPARLRIPRSVWEPVEGPSLARAQPAT
jgi:hypothetical protein